MAKTNLKPTILIVEDDEATISLLHYNLEKEGYKISICKDGEEALLMINENKPDLILLDWMLPSMSGIEICKALRSNDETRKLPIIMLSAKGEEVDRVEGLDGGVDDYLVKPFSPRELISRINAVFRRIRPAFVEKVLEYGHVQMDLTSKTASFRGEKLNLGPIEYKILQSFLEYPKRVLSREQLIRRVWGDSMYVEPRTIDVHINRLRKALRSDNKNSIIKTIRSSGYCLQPPEEQG